MSFFLKPFNNNGHFQLLMVFAVIVLLILSGCASKGDDFYMHQPTSLPLDVPPDLTLPEASSGFEIPKIGSVESQKIDLGNGALVSLKKDGRLRWLEISAPPESVWISVKDFWITKKVPLKWQNMKLGLLETEWVKHYDTEFEKDRFRIRIEPGEKPNTSQLYLSHRGVQETMIEGQVVYGWVKNLSDPELEIEVLGEMLSYFGLNAERKVALLDEAKKKADEAILSTNAEIPNIVMKETANRSWRFVMQAIDRMGHTVVERDKKVRWLDVRIEADEALDFTPGFALSNSDRDVYRVQLSTANDLTTITVLNDQGQADRSEDAKLFLQDLHSYL